MNEAFVMLIKGVIAFGLVGIGVIVACEVGIWWNARKSTSTIV